MPQCFQNNFFSAGRSESTIAHDKTNHAIFVN